MTLASYNPFIGQHIRTHVDGITADRGYIAHYIIPAAKAIAAAADYVLAATELTAQEQEITEGITQPPTPRVLSITGSATTLAGNAVLIEGTDLAGAGLTETITLTTGNDTVAGAEAFAVVTKITLPALDEPDGETISVGLSDAFGLPYKLPYDSVLKIYNNATETTVDTGSSFDASDLAANYIKPTAALSGHQVDVYLIV